MYATTAFSGTFPLAVQLILLSEIRNYLPYSSGPHTKDCNNNSDNNGLLANPKVGYSMLRIIIIYYKGQFALAEKNCNNW